MRSVGRLAEFIAASAGALSRATGRGGGTSLPGMVLNRLDPGALRRLGGGLGGGAVYISATNGKTTTARLLSACLRADGRDVTANAAGANLASGITAALLARERRRRAERRGSRWGSRGIGSPMRIASHRSTATRPHSGTRWSIGNRRSAGTPWSTGTRLGRRGSREEPPRCGGIGVFEVDEGALGQVAGVLQPRAVVLMNLFRDQLDRYGELETIAERWGDLARTLGPATIMLLNADDPALAHLGTLRTREPMFQPSWPEDAPEALGADPAGSAAAQPFRPPAQERIGADPLNVVLFGIDDPGIGRPDLPHAADTVRCGNCGHPLSHDLVTVGHLGHWRCEGCGLRRPEPHIRARRVHLDGLDRLTLTISGLDRANGIDGVDQADRADQAHRADTADRADETSEVDGTDRAVEVDESGGPHEIGEARDAGGAGIEIEVTAGIGGLHNAYNVTAAVAAALALGVPAETVRSGIAGVQAAFGRAEQVNLDGRSLRLLLAKNPTGANENIRCLLAEPAPLHLLVVLNDRTADGRDPSWIWDVDYEPLWDRVGSVTLAGDRCWELALRFSYGGLDPERFDVRENPADALDAAVAATPPGGVLYALPTYTALLDLRTELVRRGATHDFWQES